MSSPEALINKLHRGNYSETLIQQILTSFQAVPKLVDTDVDDILILDAPETRERIVSYQVNPGSFVDINRDRADGMTYIRQIPSIVNVYPLQHTKNGTGSILTTGRKFEGGWATDGSYYQSIASASRLNPTTNIGIVGWLRIPSGTTSGKIVFKSTQYNLEISAANTISFNVNSKTPVNGTFISDTWFHVACTYHSSNGQKIYINKVLTDSDSEVGSINSSSNDLGIYGTPAGATLLPSNAVLAHLSIVNAEFTSGWITNHYNGILDTQTNQEILTVPFVAHDNPKPDCSVGRCQVN